MNEVVDIKCLTERELRQIDNIRKEMWNQFRGVSKSGFEVEYLGKKFIVHKNVFWPHEDSKPLIKNFIIKPGDTVLDVGTGTGVIAIFAAHKGAKKIVGVDINPDAMENAKANVQKHGLTDVIDVRVSDIFSNITPNEKFDVITANLPFTQRAAGDLVEATMYDTSFRAWKQLLDNAQQHLRKDGRLYISQANFGNFDEVFALGRDNGFSVKIIGENKMPNDPRIFYAFELARNK